jgi:hypothetical protein
MSDNEVINSSEEHQKMNTQQPVKEHRLSVGNHHVGVSFRNLAENNRQEHLSDADIQIRLNDPELHVGADMEAHHEEGDDEEEEEEIDSSQAKNAKSLASLDSKKFGRQSYSSSGNASGISGMDPLKRVYYGTKNWLKNKYYEKVSFSKECYLKLLVLFPYAIILGLLQQMETIVIHDYYWSLVYKTVLALIAAISQFSIRMINNLHSDLTTIISIVGNETTPRILVKGTKRVYKNRVLGVLAFVFTFLFFLLEMTMTREMLLTNSGIGVTSSMSNNPSSVRIANNTEAFYASLGSHTTCRNCLALRQDDALLVPVSRIISRLEVTDRSMKTVFLDFPQEIIGIKSRCYTIVNPEPYTNTKSVRFRVSEIVWGRNTTYTDFDIYSANSHQVSAKRCRAVISDMRGNIAYKYNVVDGSTLRKESIHYIAASDPRTCVDYEGMCLNFARRRNATFLLVTGVFQQREYSVDKSSWFPDPLRTTNHTDFELNVQDFLAAAVATSAIQYFTVDETSDLQTNDKASRFKVVAELRIAVLVIGILNVCIAILHIVLDLIQLSRVPNALLRTLSKVVKSGALNAQSLAMHITGEMKGRKQLNPEWFHEKIRFGEDRLTVGQDYGILRFGKKSEIVRFKDKREYQ